MFVHNKRKFFIQFIEIIQNERQIIYLSCSEVKNKIRNDVYQSQILRFSVFQTKNKMKENLWLAMKKHLVHEIFL